jgi:hypothetical protein
MTERHAGWKNHPTWNVALWIANDDRRCRRAIELHHAGVGVAEILAEIFPGGATPDGIKIDEADPEEILDRCIIPRATP